MKTGHDGDCSIYSCLCNGNPEDGICTCGYGHQQRYNGKDEEMYSWEVLMKINFGVEIA